MITTPETARETTRRAGLPIEPRIRERRVEVQRANGRRRFRIVGAIVATIGLVVGAILGLHTPLASVRHVEITGAHHESDDAVLAAAGISKGEPLIDINGGTAVAALERLPWVATATVRRSWPSGVRVALIERTPVAQVPIGATSTGPVMLVDATGRVLARLASPAADLPILIGTGSPGVAGSWLVGAPGGAREDLRSAAAVRAGIDSPAGPLDASLALAASLSKGALTKAALKAGVTGAHAGGVHSWISQLQLLPSGEITAVATPSGASIVVGQDGDLPAKVTAVVTVLSDVALSAGDIVDVTVPDRPTVGLASTAPLDQPVTGFGPSGNGGPQP